MVTIGEVLALRTLEHNEQTYTRGQQGARMHGDRHAQLSYCDNRGFLVIMPCQLDDRGLWSPVGWLVRASVAGSVEVYAVPEDFSLSDKMHLALQAAVRRREARLRKEE